MDRAAGAHERRSYRKVPGSPADHGRFLGDGFRAAPQRARAKRYRIAAALSRPGSARFLLESFRWPRANAARTRHQCRRCRQRSRIYASHQSRHARTAEPAQRIAVNPQVDLRVAACAGLPDMPLWKVSTCPVRTLVLHPGFDVTIFRSHEARVRHFSLDLHWLKSRLLCTPSQKGEPVLVLEVSAYILQIRSNVNRSAECQVVGLSAGLFSRQIQTSLCQIRAESPTAGEAHSRRINGIDDKSSSLRLFQSRVEVRVSERIIRKSAAERIDSARDHQHLATIFGLRPF